MKVLSNLMGSTMARAVAPKKPSNSRFTLPPVQMAVTMGFLARMRSTSIMFETTVSLLFPVAMSSARAMFVVEMSRNTRSPFEMYS